MAIPSMNEMMYPTLQLLAEGATSARECLPGLKKWFDFSEEEMQELVPSGTRGRVFDRSDWAIFHMMKAGLIDRPRRGYYQPSTLGLEILSSEEKELSLKGLADFAAYREWKSEEKPKVEGEVAEGLGAKIETPAREAATPEDRMQQASAEMDVALTEELLEATLALSPPRFERLILDLLRAMGYGGGHDTMYRETPISGDGGIDGIINEDTLGLDAVYIQAKRYAPASTVGEPAIRDFIGALTSVGATKGVFVTTSSFSRPARDIVGRIQQRIVLIEGTRLAQLMIEHDVGVRPRKTYVIRTVDEDYFSDT